MRISSREVEFGFDKTDTVRCGKLAVAECADCGMSLCSNC
jgi:hypothetical protein